MRTCSVILFFWGKKRIINPFIGIPLWIFNHNITIHSFYFSEQNTLNSKNNTGGYVVTLRMVQRQVQGDSINKFLGLFTLIIGSFLGFILLVVGIFYLLKVCSIVMFNIPGFDTLYQVIIVVIPYIIYYCAYYYLIKKISKSTSAVSRNIARLLIVVGIIAATTTLVLAIMDFLKVNLEWLRIWTSNAHYAFIVQIILLFAIAAVLASGDAKEKDWMEK